MSSNFVSLDYTFPHLIIHYSPVYYFHWTNANSCLSHNEYILLVYLRPKSSVKKHPFIWIVPSRAQHYRTVFLPDAILISNSKKITSPSDLLKRLLGEIALENCRPAWCIRARDVQLFTRGKRRKAFFYVASICRTHVTIYALESRLVFFMESRCHINEKYVSFWPTNSI